MLLSTSHATLADLQGIWGKAIWLVIDNLNDSALLPIFSWEAFTYYQDQGREY